MDVTSEPVNKVLDSVQIYTSTGFSFEGERNMAQTWSMAGGATFKLLDKKLALPVNARAERLTGTENREGFTGGVWGFGGDVALRTYLAHNVKYVKRVDLDVGVKPLGLVGDGDRGFGMVTFARLGLGNDKVNLEGGVLVYDQHERIGNRGYIMLNLNALDLGRLFIDWLGSSN